MSGNLSPKQVARAVGASESSVKRWCDQGLLPSFRTAGGHRRITVDAVMKFTRESERPLLHPEILGIPVAASNGVRGLDEAQRIFLDGLLEGSHAICRQIVHDLYMSNTALSKICDDVMAVSMHAMGDRWGDGTAEIYQERRSCESVTQLLHELHLLISPPRTDAPSALGASICNDPYALPLRMIELVLRESSWNAVSLGGPLPASTVCRAIERHRPRMFCLSASAIEDVPAFLAEFSQIRACCGDRTALVVGGRGLTGEIRKQMDFSAYCDNLQQLTTCASSLYPEHGASHGREKGIENAT